MELLKDIKQDQLDLVGLLIVQYPICYILSIIKNPKLKQLYIIVLGLLCMIYFFGMSKFTYLTNNCCLAAIYIMAQPVIAYILMQILPFKANCLVTLIFAFATLSYVHYIRIFWDEGQWSIDCNVPMMINTLKIASIPFILYDGSKKEDELKYNQSIYKITQKPTFLEYFSYVLFIPTVVIGPYYEYSIHHNYIHNKGIFEAENRPSRWPHVLDKTARALAYIVVYVLSQKYFNYEIFFTRRDFGILEFISVALAYTLKFRYIIGWMFTEAHFAISGISLNKTNDKLDYNGIKIVDDYEVVFNSNPITIFNVS